MVAPLAGAWIEIITSNAGRFSIWSLPLRERGLKYKESAGLVVSVIVAPLAGAWIEISR